MARASTTAKGTPAKRPKAACRPSRSRLVARLELDAARLGQPAKRFHDAVPRPGQLGRGTIGIDRGPPRAAFAAVHQLSQEGLPVGRVSRQEGRLGLEQPKLIAGIERSQWPDDPAELQVGEHRLDHQRADVGRLCELVKRKVELALPLLRSSAGPGCRRHEQLAQELAQRLRRGRVAVGEVLERDQIVGAGQELADGGRTVAARLLRVVRQGLRQVVVIDAADVGLVDAHAEGDRGDDRVDAAGHEGILRCMPRVVRQAGMVGAGLEATLLEVLRHLLGRLLERHVDDRRPLPRTLPRLEPAREQGQAIAVGAGRDPVREIRPPKRRLHMVGLGDAEGAADVGRHRGRRRGRQRQDGADAELPGHVRQPQVLGPKVVPPLRDAVGLVHRHQRHPGPRQPPDELLARQPLRRDVEQPEAAGADALMHARRLGRRQRGIEPRRRDAPAPRAPRPDPSSGRSMAR